MANWFHCGMFDVSMDDAGVHMTLREMCNPDDFNLAATHFTPQDTVLIGGAGSGLGVFLLSCLLTPNRIIAYEADPFAAMTMRHRIFAWDQAPDIRHGALVTYDGEVAFYRSKQWQWSGLYPDLIPDIESVHTVRAVDTNRVVREEHVTALWLNVEDAEKAILPALDLSRVRAVVCEMHGAEDGFDTCLDHLEASGLVMVAGHRHPFTRTFAFVREGI